MNVKKPLLIAGAVVSIGSAGLGGTALVNAQTTSTSSDPQSSLVDKLVSKFNLNKADVQAVFDEDKAAREADRKAEVEKELTQLVTDGKITEDQKAKILAKRDELEKNREANRTAMQGKTDDERKAAMDAERTALDKWASDNGIDKTYLRYVFGGGHGGPGGGRGFGGPRDGAPASSDSSSSSTSSN